MQVLRQGLCNRVVCARANTWKAVPVRVARFSNSCSRLNTRKAIRPVGCLVEEKVRQGKLRSDEEQLDLASRLDDLRESLIETDKHVISSEKLSVELFYDSTPKGLVENAKAFSRQLHLNFLQQQQRHPTPQGIYIHGSVGVGKSFLMDLFVETMIREQQHDNKNNTIISDGQSTRRRRQIKRVHFHEFMLDVHDRIHQFKKRHPKEDPVPPVALSLARESRLLCLDEFQVTDIADAMILKRLLSMLWMENKSYSIGTVLIATSNRAPEDLYEGGLNRSLFLPFIDTIRKHMEVIEMKGEKDYRKLAPETEADVLLRQSYFSPADCPETRKKLEQIFAACGSVEEHQSTQLPVRMNRQVYVPKGNDQCAWFDFVDLCDQPLGAADYWSICQRYDVVIVDHVPQLTAARFNEARRFVTLIDALYESQTKVVLAADVSLDQLLVHFEAMVESNDGDEEIAVEEINEQTTTTTNVTEEMFVKGEGGSSSSSSTTMIRTKDGGEVEWSATGRIGVSLAQLSAIRDVSFSFMRAESRLVEMTNGTWGQGV